jgi:hypothetical protein
MTTREYKNYTQAQLIGRKVKALRELKNGYSIAPAGIILTITGKQNGIHAVGPRCKSCGVAVYFKKIEPAALELL